MQAGKTLEKTCLKKTQNGTKQIASTFLLHEFCCSFGFIVFFLKKKKKSLIFIPPALMFCLHAHLSEGVGPSRTEGTDSCELPGRCWESHPCSLEEQLVLLNHGCLYFPINLTTQFLPSADCRSSSLASQERQLGAVKPAIHS